MISKGLGWLAAAAMWLVAGTALANRYNLPEPHPIIAREIYDLHTLIMWIIVGIFVVVFGAMIYSIIKHRRAAGHKVHQFHENVMVEIAWTIVPFLILIGMAYPATKTVISMQDASSPDKTIKATGYQWKRDYDDLKAGISFYSSLATRREQIDDNSNEGSRSAVNPNFLLEVEPSG
jgi:cytochrome c oxidase subunit II